MAYKLNIRGASAWENVLKDTNIEVTDANSNFTSGVLSGVLDELFNAGGGSSSPLTTKGDVHTYSTVDARLPVGSNGQVMSADSTETTGLKWIDAASGGGSGIEWETVTADTTAVDGSGYMADTSIQEITITLPAAPTAGMQVGIKDYAGTFDTFNCLVDPGTKPIEGSSEIMTFDSKGYAGTFVYADATKGWVLVTSTPQTMIMSKPFMHVMASTVKDGTSADNLSYIDRPYDRVVTNEIIGASLGSGEVTLPAGKYYIDADQMIRGLSTTYAFAALSLLTTDDTLLIEGTISGGQGGATAHKLITNSRVSGQINLTATTTVKIAGWMVNNGNYNFGSASGSTTLPNKGELKIWKIDSDRVQTVLDDPTLVLARPMMQLQYHQDNLAYSMVAGQLDLPLNREITNDITSATWATDGNITLPAGIYYIDAHGFTYNSINAPSQLTILDDSDDSVLLTSPWGNQLSCDVTGKIVLTSSTVIKIHKYQYAATQANVPRGLDNVYHEIKIWQLDAVNKQPVLVNDKLYPLPGSTYVTGNMHGLEYYFSAANEVTVYPGICMDSLNSTVLSLASAQAVSLGTTAFETYNLFLCDDGVVRSDTDINGANLGAYDPFRWIGFASNDGGGNLILFQMRDNIMTFGAASQVRLQSITSTVTAVDVGLVAPVSRISEVRLGAHNATAGANSPVIFLMGSAGTYTVGGVNARGYVDDNSNGAWCYNSSLYDGQPVTCAYTGANTLFAKETSHGGGTTYIVLHSVTIKR